MGMSSVGGCRRRAGYEWNEVPETDDGGSVQAVLGTLTHDGLGSVARKVVGDANVIELEVMFAGVLGHLDFLWIDPETGEATIIDWKTTGHFHFLHVVEEGPSLNELFQTVLYAAGAARLGYEVVEIILDYVDRDTGEHFRYRRAFDLDELRAALRWLDGVRETPLEALPREFRPGSPWCNRCPFRTDCWGSYQRPGRSPLTALFIEHPDAAWWRDQLAEGRDMERDGKKQAKDARGALEAVMPIDAIGQKSAPCVVDEDGPAIVWSIGEDVRTDLDRVRLDYAAWGREVPVTRTRKVTTKIVPRPEGDDQ